MSAGAPTRLRAVDLFTVIYLGVTLPVYFFLPLDTWPMWRGALLHAAGMAGVIAARRGGLGRFRAGRFVLDLYPLVFFGLLYSEAATLNRVFLHEGYRDGWILRVEEQWFGCQPSRDWRVLLPWKPLSEYVHLGYFSYYTYVPALAFVLLRGGRRAAWHNAVASIAFSFYCGFILFIALPAAGPYYQFAHLDPNLGGYVMPRVTQWIVDRGSSLGTAFPSSHVSVSVTTWVMAMRYRRKLAVVMAFLVPAMAFGAVYGGYHYLTDILAGTLLGVFSATFGHALARRWNRRADLC